jgi:hypothetical protein
VHIIGDIFFIKNKIIIMSDLLDDNNHGYSGSEESFSAIGKSRMKSIASSVFTVGVIQVIFISVVFGCFVFCRWHILSAKQYTQQWYYQNSRYIWFGVYRFFILLRFPYDTVRAKAF